MMEFMLYLNFWQAMTFWIVVLKTFKNVQCFYIFQFSKFYLYIAVELLHGVDKIK